MDQLGYTSVMEAHGYRGTPAHRTRMGDERTLAQYFSLGIGAVLTLVGLIGFAVNSDFSTGTELTSDSLLGFDVNGWHNVAHLATGLLGLYMGTDVGLSRIYAAVIGITYLALFIWGLIDKTILGAVPINTPDMVLHGAIAIAGIAVAMAPDTSDSERRLDGQ